jgi:hypothetical protein
MLVSMASCHCFHACLRSLFSMKRQRHSVTSMSSVNDVEHTESNCIINGEFQLFGDGLPDDLIRYCMTFLSQSCCYTFVRVVPRATRLLPMPPSSSLSSMEVNCKIIESIRTIHTYTSSDIVTVNGFYLCTR